MKKHSDFPSLDIISGYEFAGELILKWALDKSTRPENLGEFEVQMTKAGVVFDYKPGKQITNFAGIQFIDQCDPKDLCITLPHPKVADEVQNQGLESYAPPDFYKQDPTGKERQFLLKRIADYCTSKCH